MCYTILPYGNGANMSKFMIAIGALFFLGLAGCTGDDEDSAKDTAVDSAAE